MTTFANLSAESKDIIFGLYDKLRGRSIISDTNRQLMVSLYGTMPFAIAEVLNILDRYRVNLTDYLSTEAIALLQNEYAAVIPFCFQRAEMDRNSFVHRYEGTFPVPNSLIDLCMEMAGDTSGKSVFLPYAGEGAFALRCHGAHVKGFEFESESWAVSQILISSLPGAQNHRIARGPGEKTTSQDETFDFVFSLPPFQDRRGLRTVVDTFYGIITRQLKVGGELYAILPRSFCYEGAGWFDVRKILLDYYGQYSVLVVALPPMLLPITNVPLCIVNFVKDRRGLVCLVDASGEEFYARQDVAGTKEFSLKVESILETIRKQDEKYVWIGDAKDLNSSLNLSPARYLLEQNTPDEYEGHTTVRLGELIAPVPLTRNEEADQDTPIIGMRELSFKYLNCDISIETIPVKQDRFAKVLTDNALLTGFMSGKFKVGRIEGLSSRKYVALTSDVFAFRIISKAVTEDYLLRSLLSGFSERQAIALARGTTLTRLDDADLLNIRIPLPSIEEQDRICKEDTRASLSESDRLIIESFEEFRDDMHMKKHAIGQTIFNLTNWWKALQKARMEGDGVVKDTATVGKNQPVSVSEIYNSIQEVISQLQQQISKFDRGNGLEIKTFALTEFIEDYIARKKSPLFEFIYDSKPHHADELRDYDIDVKTGKVIGGDRVILEAGMPIEYVDFAPDALTIILDNIVSNACSHGFEGRDDATNIIKIDLSTQGDDCIVSVSNNGEPLNDQISVKDVFTYSRTSKNGKGHFGIGGYEVRKLMREFGGDAEFVSDPDSEYPVTYKLIFHNTNIKSLEL
ncbi:MAG: restriction endonuclease subunit S [Bacteroidales bacterium]|nr:restriction endonuclease subunit S [Bacteroidales bacterium]